jgi:hypothetical protein
MAYQLTCADLYLAGHAGVMRRISAISKKRLEPYGKPQLDLWGLDIESCAAELLVSRALNQSWTPYASSPDEIISDVGRSVQVRQTSRLNGCLILHDKDNDDHAFVLVVGTSNNQRICGWIRGIAGKQKLFWRTDTGRPAYFVPQSILKPLSEFQQ